MMLPERMEVWTVQMTAAFSGFVGPLEAYLEGFLCSGHVHDRRAGHSRDPTIDTQPLAYVLLGDGHSFCPPLGNGCSVFY